VGVAGPWALAARPGETLELVGPGGAYAPSPGADWHLMAGDPSVLPAIGASLARVPAGRRVDVLVQVADADDEVELSSPGDLRVQWLHEPGDAVLADAVRALDWPAGEVHAFVHGEASSVRELRRLLLGERGLAREAVSISGYWKRTRTEEGWREDKPEWNRLVEADLTAA
jgi:NADPH-dependent ferric siderophore reductase